MATKRKKRFFEITLLKKTLQKLEKGNPIKMMLLNLTYQEVAYMEEK